MNSINEITGDKLISKIGNKKAFDRGYDEIFMQAGRDVFKDEPAITGTTPSKCDHWVLGWENWEAKLEAEDIPPKEPDCCGHCGCG